MNAGMPDNILLDNKRKKDNTFEQHMKTSVDDRMKLREMHKKVDQKLLRKGKGMPEKIPVDPLTAAITDVVLDDGTANLPENTELVTLPSGEQFVVSEKTINVDISDMIRNNDGTIKLGGKPKSGMPDRIK